jgi:hypothetical protein
MYILAVHERVRQSGPVPELAHVGQLSERRTSHLWDAFFAATADGTGMPRGPLDERFGLSLRYPAAVVFSELKQPRHGSTRRFARGSSTSRGACN